MRHSTVSMLAFGVYIAVLCLWLVFWPDGFTGLLGLEPAPGPWIRVLGVVLGVLAFYYAMAIREEARTFYRWTVYGRAAVLPVFALMVLFRVGPPIMLLFGALDAACGIWTGVALRGEARRGR